MSKCFVEYGRSYLIKKLFSSYSVLTMECSNQGMPANLDWHRFGEKAGKLFVGFGATLTLSLVGLCCALSPPALWQRYGSGQRTYIES